MPAISVIVPVYKVEKYIHRCVGSILAQTFRDFELILVDDGSPDSCGGICDAYAAKDNRIHVIHQENAGLSAARNAGIDWTFAKSDSEYLTFIDSDDWVHPKYLQALYDALQNSGVGISVCGYAETEGEDPESGEICARQWTPEDFYIAHNVNAIVAWGKLYRKEDFKDVRYPVGRIHEDEFTTHKLLFAHKKIAVIDAPLYAYFQNPEGITKSPWTPKRSDGAVALNQQRMYFKTRGFDRAHRAATAACAGRLCSDITTVEKLPEHKARSKQLRALLRKILRQERIMLPFVREHFWFYEVAYPKRMYVYWTCVGICGKLKKGWKQCRKQV